MRRIAVFADFITEDYRRQIDRTAEKTGFSTTYFADRDALAAEIGAFEVLFGYIPPSLLAGAERLRWFCAASAGVDHLLEDSLWPSQDCLLSNSSGAYGPTISEHVLMVLLMLLRRMPEYQADLRERRWSFYSPIRSITGSRIVMLGTGDIGANTARRLKALGASVTGVCRSGRSGEAAFDRVVPIGALDSVLPEADAPQGRRRGSSAGSGLHCCRSGPLWSTWAGGPPWIRPRWPRRCGLDGSPGPPWT